MTSKVIVRSALVIAWLALLPHSVVAQTTGIAGQVKDASGAVMPGVTIEATSPTMIEKVRTAVTNDQGLYQIIDLRPGTYTVIFTLAGFTTVRREGIELAGAFTATINAEMTVGSLQETLTVSGESPTVDIKNVVNQKVLTEEFRDLLPSARSVQTMAVTIPGIVSRGGDRPSAQDVGGLTGERGQLQIHGSRTQDFSIQMDGMTMNHPGGVGSSQSFTFNPAESEEYVYEVGAIAASNMAGGVRANVIPKEGSNRYSGFALTWYTPGSFQSDNLDDDLLARGLSTPNSVEKIWDYNFASGGPLLEDRLWFFASYRDWGGKEQAAGAYRMIDPTSYLFSPRLGVAGNVDVSDLVATEYWSKAYGLRLTWQANEKNKFSIYGAHQPREKINDGANGTTSLEAATYSPAPINFLIQGSWRSPISNRILVDVGFAVPESNIPGRPTIEGIEPNLRTGVSDTGTGLRYRAPTGQLRDPLFLLPSVRAAVSYVTGSHAAKIGLDYTQGFAKFRNEHLITGMSYTFRNGLPNQITFQNPVTREEHVRMIGLYAQDQWTISRWTVNAGLRFDYHNEWIPDDVVTSGPSPFTQFQTWPGVKNVPNWKDLSPRLGVAYDLFGNGKTAVKATFSRYVVRDHTQFAADSSPATFNRSATRIWDDANRDFVGQENELQPLSNSAFGTAATTTHTDDAIREGWHVRPANWETSASIQHEVMRGLGVNFAYTRRSYVNFTVTDNLALTSTDYDPFCFTPPADPRHPGVGGSQICGVYDLNPSKRSVTPDILRTNASNYGDQREIYSGIDISVNVRLPQRMQLYGGISKGTTDRNSLESCFVIDSPEALRFCDTPWPWQTSARLGGSATLPWEIDFGAVFQSSPGPQIQANYQITNAVVEGLGRPLTASRTVPLIQPGTVFSDRLYQLDLRLSKTMRVRNLRIRALLDIANATNANPVLVFNNTYGANWLQPSYVLPGRLFKPGVEVSF